MSDVMLFGVLKMPYEMAMSSELSRLQFYQRVQQLVARVEAQPEQEPVEDVVAYHSDGTRTVRIAPKRPWVGLTDEDISLIDWESLATKKDCARAIEAKLKELNT